MGGFLLVCMLLVSVLRFMVFFVFVEFVGGVVDGWEVSFVVGGMYELLIFILGFVIFLNLIWIMVN